jgi:uncharacterized protein YecT (DUF1311 family)
MKIKLFPFTLLLISIFAAADGIDCKNSATTLEINACINDVLENENRVLGLYLSKAKERYTNQPRLTDLMNQSQQDWLVYRQSHCDSIYDIWSDGSIRGLMFGECMLKLTKQRTHQIWEDYLTYMDNTPSLLPEPK